MKMAALFLTLAACALHAQPTLPSFEAAIGPHEGPLQRIGDFAISGARVTYRGYNPVLLVMEAYNLKPGTGDNPCFVRLGPVQPNDRNYRYQFTNRPIDRLANAIQADRPILDKTGLTGLHDLVFFATPDRTLHDSDPGDISIRDAVRQFGLRLDATKAPIEMLVIDHIEKPADN
jgi:hypothetical protein